MTGSHDQIRIAYRNYSALFLAAILCACSRRPVPHGTGGSEGRAPVVRARAFTVDAVAFAPGTKKVWAVGGRQISMSADAGRTWSAIDAPIPSPGLRALAVADERLALAAGDDGVIVRKDSSNAEAWTQVYPRTQGDIKATLNAIAIDHESHEALAAGEHGSVLWSQDAGVTWAPITIPIAGQAVELHAAAMTKRGAWLLGEHILLHRERGGVDWRIVDLPAALQSPLDSIEFDASGQKGFIGSTENVSLWTDDGGDHWKVSGPYYHLRPFGFDFGRDLLFGQSEDGSLMVIRRERGDWSVVSPPDDSEIARFHVAIEPVSGDLVFARGGYIAVGRMDQLTETVTPALSGIFDFVMDADGLRGWGAGVAGKVVATRDGGRHWEVLVPEGQPNDRIFALARTNGQLWALRNFSVDVSDDGRNWRPRWKNPTKATFMSFAVTADGRRLLIGGRDVIYDIADGSDPVAVEFPTQQFASLAISADGRNALAASESGRLFRRTDGKWHFVTAAASFRRARLAMTPDGRRAWCATDGGAILGSEDGGEHWDVMLSSARADSYFKGIEFDAEGRSGLAITENAIYRSGDGGRTWFLLPPLVDDQTFTACHVPSADDGFISTWKGSFIATEAGRRKPALAGLDFVVKGKEVSPDVHVVSGSVPREQLEVSIDVSGTAIVDAARDKVHREYALDTPPSWPRDYFTSQDTYVFHVSLFDGWNVVDRTFRHRFAKPLWLQFTDWMGWTTRGDVSQMFATAVPRNLGLLIIVYYAAILLLFIFNPYAFIVWHERIAGRLPERLGGVAKLMAPLAVGSDRCIDALVARYADNARGVFGSHTLLRDRAGWAPAPLRIGDEEYLRFARPAELPAAEPYIAGLTEIRRRLPHSRTVISIQGPGGVGKSSLAFQIGRWALSGDRATRLFSAVSLPVIVTAMERPLDDVMGDAAAALFGWTIISLPLKQALLEKKRVLAIIDGLSEMPPSAAANVDPLSSARWTHAIVMTSRTATHIAGELVAAPMPLGLSSLDSALNSLVDQRLGANFFEGTQREEIRSRCVELLRASDDVGPAVPMLFLKLLVDRAAELLKRGQRLDALPSTFNGLVDAYVAGLLNDDPALMAAARQAAVVAVALDLAPGWRARSQYLSVISDAMFDKLVMSGLLERTGLSAAPLYKFSIDPVSEYLAAMEIVLRAQAGTLDAALAARLRDSTADSSLRAAIAFCAKYLGIPLETVMAQNPREETAD